jgi:ankyrin repeat protein
VTTIPKLWTFFSKGADPNLQGEGFPINKALNRSEFLTKLLAARCDPNVPFKDGWGTAFSALTTAIRDNRLDILKLLLSRGTNVNVPGQGLPIVNAASCNDSERLRMVLDAGADVNLKFEGYTALMKACEENKMDNVKLLLKAGADMDAMDDKGNTATDLAANKGHDEIVMLLLDGGVE